MRGLRPVRDEHQVDREALGRPVVETDMASDIQKITLSASRDIPFNKLLSALATSAGSGPAFPLNN
jgi:ParB family chromosome partitioning protein